MKLLKKNYIFVIIFVVVLFYTMIVSYINLDEVWNYGFSYAIAKGEIPYVDFNMVITPLFPLLMALFLKLFSINSIVFYIVNSLIVTIMFYFINKMIPRKYLLLILSLMMFPISILFPSYNLFLLFLFIIFLYSYNKNDYLFGLMIGLMFLTKQHIGFVFFFTMFFGDRKSVLKRLSSFSLCILIFLGYLVCCNSLNDFMNLCVYGLFEFGEKNGTGINLFCIISLILLSASIILYFKNKNADYLYLTLFFSILIPIFDFYHFQIYFIAWIITYLKNNKIKDLIKYDMFAVAIILFVFFQNGIFDVSYKINSYNNFQFRYLRDYEIKQIKKINSNYIKYDKVIILGNDSYFYKIINNRKINYFDLVNDGNWGYLGEEKLVNYIKEHKDYYYFVDEKELEKGHQVMDKPIEYVMDHGEVIKDLGKYSIYKLK